MKTSDIVADGTTTYAWNRYRTGGIVQKAVVLATRVERQYVPSDSIYPKTVNDGVLINFTNGAGETVSTVVPPREIVELWADHKARQAARAQAAKENAEHRKAAATGRALRLDALRNTLGEDVLAGMPWEVRHLLTGASDGKSHPIHTDTLLTALEAAYAAGAAASK